MPLPARAVIGGRNLSQMSRVSQGVGLAFRSAVTGFVASVATVARGASLKARSEHLASDGWQTFELLPHRLHFEVQHDGLRPSHVPQAYIFM